MTWKVGSNQASRALSGPAYLRLPLCIVAIFLHLLLSLSFPGLCLTAAFMNGPLCSPPLLLSSHPYAGTQSVSHSHNHNHTLSPSSFPFPFLVLFIHSQTCPAPGPTRSHYVLLILAIGAIIHGAAEADLGEGIPCNGDPTYLALLLRHPLNGL